MCEQYSSYGETLRIKDKKIKQNLPEDYSKEAKIASATCKFLKFFRWSMPPDPPEPFLFCIQLQISSAIKKHA